MADRNATLDDLLKQAKVTNRLLAAQMRGQLSQTDLIALLQDSDLSAREVAEILGTSAATVAVTLQRLRNRKRNKE
jgi:DNA-directed RNA polymerase specialized sigma24 family protein